MELTTDEPNSASNVVPTDVEWLKSNKKFKLENKAQFCRNYGKSHK